MKPVSGVGKPIEYNPLNDGRWSSRMVNLLEETIKAMYLDVTEGKHYSLYFPRVNFI
jgi:hypothetical protein